MLFACRAMDVAVSCFLPELHPPGLLWLIASGATEEPGKVLDAFFLPCVYFFLGLLLFHLAVARMPILASLMMIRSLLLPCSRLT